MPDRTINWGDDATEASYQTQDTDAVNGGGTFVVVRDLGTDTIRLAWDPTGGSGGTGALITGGPLAMGGDAIENAGNIDIGGTDVATVADLNDTIDLIQVADADSLPDPANVTQPTIAYLDAEDDYAGVFQA